MNKAVLALALCSLWLSGCGLVDGFVSADSTPTPAPGTVNAVYLPFERGFMVYVEGADCLYAYADGIIIPAEISSASPSGMYHYCIEFADLPDAPTNAPEFPFGRVWQRYAEMQQFLGVPSGGAQRYQARIPRSDPVVMGGVFYAGAVTLPNGRRLYCGTRGATAGHCELRR
jgi:hypothetical protein